MNVRNAGMAIRQARKFSGLTQEQLAEGICEYTSLSRIESGLADVSQNTFQQLMHKAGVSSSCFPAFKSKQEFQVFRELQKLVYALDGKKYSDCISILTKIEEYNYGDNIEYYSLVNICVMDIMFQTQSSNFVKNIHILRKSINVLNPYFDLNCEITCYIGIPTVKALILLGECNIQLHQMDEAYKLTNKIESYLEKCIFTPEEIILLTGKNILLQIRLLIEERKYSEAEKKCLLLKTLLVNNQSFTSLCEVYFLWTIVEMELGECDKAKLYFETAFYTSYGFQNGYSNLILCYMKKYYPQLEIDMEKYPYIEPESFYGKIYIFLLKREFFFISDKKENMTNQYLIGHIIHDLRKEKGISQQMLCQGLCSKSKLSKIENNQMNLGSFLFEALFERLGIQSNLCYSYSSKNEYEIAKMRVKIKNEYKKIDKNKDSYLFEKYKDLLKPKDIINKQWLLMMKLLCVSSGKINIDDINKILEITIPNFDLNKVFNYTLSYNELTLLANRAFALANSRQTIQKAIFLCKMLLEYYERISADDVIFSKNYILIVCCYIASLYRIKDFWTLVKLFVHYRAKFGVLDRRHYARIYFYYSQSLFEIGKRKEGLMAAKITCALNQMVDDEENIYLLKKYIMEDFNVAI